jgi:orotidine-5'-phosphate decarboxylase
MTRQDIISQIKLRQSFLIVGLDTELEKIPAHLKKMHNPVLAFNKAIIEATSDYCIGYKINTAFYEAMGSKGWETMEQTLLSVPPGYFTIADAKRGDIGNTSGQYARAFFHTYGYSAVTVAPYMGEDSIRPFLNYTDKWTILLALTSNQGSSDFQMLQTGNQYLYEAVVEKAATWGSEDNLMFVVGATHPDKLASLRKRLPRHFFLVPGIGAQGGDLQAICRAGINEDCGLLVNVSRSIIYASSDEDFADKARHEAHRLQKEMAAVLVANHIV